jgi:Peptidase propeptide and YPEB domain
MGFPRLAATMLVLVPLGMGVALGQTATAPATPAPATTARTGGPGLAIPDLVERLTREGYRDFSEIERKGDKLYKVGARDAQGRSMELAVDARTAEVLASEEDDDK